MRKLSVMLVIVALLAVAVAPSFAQDEEPGTIADIVVASAGGEEPEFTSLLAAVQAADPSVLEALSDPEAELTVFAPTDAAFAALGEETLGALLEDPETLTDILLFHVRGSLVMSEDVVTRLEEGDGAFKTRSLQGQYIDIAGSVEEGITVDGANLNLEMIDIEASNGVIHVIDAVITPETETIAGVVTRFAEAEEPQFASLLLAVTSADPAVLEALSNEEAELTVFAPTDEAFAALGEEALNGLLEDPEALTPILLYHVTDGITTASQLGDLLEENDGEVMVPMLSEDEATFTVTDEGIFVDGAQIIMTNVDASNGIIHVIDAVITPSAE